MNVDDLARMLKGANVTINVQGGTGNTMYTAPVQINTYNNNVANREPRCKICGRSGGADLYSHFVGYAHQSCIERQGKEARSLRAQKQAGLWQIVGSRHNDEIKEAPRQLPAPSTAPEELDPLEQWDCYAYDALLSKVT